MAVLIFVRHGQALTNELGVLSDEKDGYPLTEEGVKTASRTALELKKLKVTKLYSSPILRAKQTAEIIGKQVKLEPIIDERLKDRGFGEFLGKPHNGGEWLFEVDWDNTAVEKSDAVLNRMLDFMKSISNDEGIIVIASHEDEIKVIVMHLLELNYDDFHFGIKIANSGMTVLSTGKGGYKLLAVNYPLLPEWLISKINKEIGPERTGKA